MSNSVRIPLIPKDHRHPDFQRILDEFIHYYKDSMGGWTEYMNWLDALSLDDTKPYAYSQTRARMEAIRWANRKRIRITLL